VVPLLAFAMLGCPQRDNQNRSHGVVGYYVSNDMKGWHLGIEDGRWMMRDMLSGFGGTWIKGKDNENATFTINEGPSGKRKGNEKLTATRTASGITLSLAGTNSPPMKFKFVAPSAPKEFGYDEFLGPKK